MHVWRRSRVGASSARPARAYTPPRRTAADSAPSWETAVEAFGVQTGGVAQGGVLVDSLAPVGHDQGYQGTCTGDHTE